MGTGDLPRGVGADQDLAALPVGPGQNAHDLELDAALLEYGMVLAGTLLLSLWLLPHTGYGATVMCVLVHTVLIRGKAVRLKVHQVVRSFTFCLDSAR